jgi:hypothetical protein
MWTSVPTPDGTPGARSFWWKKRNWSTWRKSVPVPLCPRQIPYELVWDWTRVTGVNRRRLNAWTTSLPRQLVASCLFLARSLLRISSTLKKEVILSYETSANYWATRHDFPEEILHSRSCETFRSSLRYFVWSAWHMRQLLWHCCKADQLLQAFVFWST